MGEAFIVRRGGVSSEETAAPTITIVSETPTDVTFTLTNNDDNTALITFEIDDQIGGVELAAAATSSNITVALAAGTYTLSAFATVVGEVASSATTSVEIIVYDYELLFDSEGIVTLPQSQINITGLNIAKEDTLKLVYTFVGNVDSTEEYALHISGVTSNSYRTQLLIINGTSISPFTTSVPVLTQALLNSKTVGFANIKISENNRAVYNSDSCRAIGSQSSGVFKFYINTTSTVDISSITSVRVSSRLRANGIGPGSRLQLYKITGAA